MRGRRPAHGREATSEVQILLSIRTLSGAGAELVVETLATGIDRRLFAVTVCEGVGTGEKAQALRALGYDVVSLVPSGSARQSYFNALRLRRLVASKRIDLIHSHSAVSLSDAALCKLLCPRLRIVHTFHYGNYPYLESSVARLERVFARFADARVAVGHVQRAAIQSTYGFADAEITTIWNGVRRRPVRPDHARIDPLRARGRVLIGTVGTLIEQKGYFELLDVALILKQRGLRVQFVIAGGGRLQAAIEQRVRDLGLGDCVEFLGWVRDASETILPAVDIFFQPSRWEAMSIVLLEAAALGLPILCTDVGEASRILEAGKEALIVPPRDTARMADSLQHLIEDASLRSRLGAAARAKVETCCMAESMVQQYQRLYLEVLGRTPGQQTWLS